MLKKLVFSCLMLICGMSALAAAEPTLYCRIDPVARPIVFLKYFKETKTAYVMSGFPAKWTKYTDVVEMTGLPPFGTKGKSLVAFGGDVPLIHYRKTGNATTWYEQMDTRYPYAAVWGSLPGAKPKAEGVCWTPSEQPKSIGN